MLHVIYGDGNGKTTSAAGLALRAAGHGLPVLFIQFLKDGTSGEVLALKKLDEVTVCHPSVHCGFTWMMTKEQKEETGKECRKLLKKALNRGVFLIVLDEVLHALRAGFISRAELEEVLAMSSDCEIVLTGREAPDWLLEHADYATNVGKTAHPLDRGIQAREGVEY